MINCKRNINIVSKLYLLKDYKNTLLESDIINYNTIIERGLGDLELSS